MGIFNKKKEEKQPDLSGAPNMEACNKLFWDMCDLMYKDKRTIVELEIVLGMLQNEIIMNKTHNAIMSQIGRLAFIPPVMPMPPMEDIPTITEETKTDDRGSSGQHYG